MKPPIYEVQWDDHAFSPEDEGTIKQRSVGYLIRKNKKIVVIAQSRDANGKYMDKLTVDKRMVRKVKRLRG